MLGAGLIRPTRMTEAYESVFEVDADNAEQSSATCETLMDWTLTSPLVAPAFEKFAREMAGLTKAHAPGFVSSRLRRFLGNETRYLTIAISTDHAAARGRYQAPEIRAHLQAHPYTEFASQPVSAENFDMVKRYAPASSATAAQASVAAAVGR